MTQEKACSLVEGFLHRFDASMTELEQLRFELANLSSLRGANYSATLTKKSRGRTADPVADLSIKEAAIRQKIFNLTLETQPLTRLLPVLRFDERLAFELCFKRNLHAVALSKAARAHGLTLYKLKKLRQSVIETAVSFYCIRISE